MSSFAGAAWNHFENAPVLVGFLGRLGDDSTSWLAPSGGFFASQVGSLQDIEEVTGFDVSSLRVRHSARLDRDLGDVELDVYRARQRLPRVRPGSQLKDDVGLRA